MRLRDENHLMDIRVRDDDFHVRASHNDARGVKLHLDIVFLGRDGRDHFVGDDEVQADVGADLADFTGFHSASQFPQRVCRYPLKQDRRLSV